MAENMNDGKARLQTLRRWPKRNLFNNLSEFSKAGFYYEASLIESDALCCDYCMLMLKRWVPGDNPWIEHAKYFTGCINLQAVKGRQWIKRHACQFRFVPENIHTVQGQQNHGLTPILDSKEFEFQSQRKMGSASDCRYTTRNGLKFSLPKHPDKAEQSDRERTIKACRRFKSVYKARRFAEAGFFWTGDGVTMRCFHCSFVFEYRNFNDDPFEEHARLNPGCLHLVLELGEENIAHVGSPYMDRHPVEEENLNTNGCGDRRNCSVCGQLRRPDERICCLRCHSAVCLSEDCLTQHCC